ncbi:hypothetical protein UA08_03504 [Talaromyces atroroseus]|uniref:protein S-acyltransferase n=1 Tax=Talaromyces atroroseus TaxID=1441469 RepID=A0A225AIV9_TALAT|nr:hypothetical protein UA08_03504 [Talaromyces atroroseus]OKL61391.1 hypothetical protein UA08_03504 [Talaromyces atroroseus]
MVKASTTPKAGSRTDPEAIERRRMQNRLAQRKRRMKRAQLAKEEKERQQRLQAAQAVSRLTFMNESYMSNSMMGRYHEQKFHPALQNRYFTTSTPPPFEDIFASSPYVPPTPVPPFESDPSFFVAGYPSPSLSGYAPSTPPLSLYTPSLVGGDLSNIRSSSSSSSNNSNSNSNIDIDPSLFMGQTLVGGVSSSAPGPAKSQALDAFGLVLVQPDRHRSTSLPSQFSPPRSVPSLSSPPLPPSMIHRKGSHHKTNNHNNLHTNNMNPNPSPNPSHASAHTHGKTGLHVCAEQGNTHVVQLLLGYGADMDGLDEYGRTPLHYAVRNNHTDVVKQLVERGASITITDVNGISPVHIAAEAGSEEMVQMMMPMTMTGQDMNLNLNLNLGPGLGLQTGLVTSS